MATSFLGANSNILPNTAAAFGVISTLIGINAVLRPRSALKIFDFKLPDDPKSHQLIDALLLIYGARDIGLGLLTLIVWYHGDRTALGWSVLIGSSVPVADGIVSGWVMGEDVWKHFAFVPVMAAVGAGLLGWLG